MANKIPWYALWDLKSMMNSVVTLLLIGGLIASFIYVPDLLYDYKISNYKGETEAQLTAIEPIEIIRQTELGNKIRIESYKVSYRYSIDGFFYESTKIIKSGKVRKNNLLQSNEHYFFPISYLLITIFINSS